MVRLGHLEIIIVGKDILAKQFGDFQTIREYDRQRNLKYFKQKRSVKTESRYNSNCTNASLSRAVRYCAWLKPQLCARQRACLFLLIPLNCLLCLKF